MSANYQESKDRYLKEKVETFVVRVPKGQKSLIQERAKSLGKSLNSYILDLINSDMEEDS
ncbi:MAG: Arc family DNA-binding protein [Oscillospiraceae bacterium]|jgi:predicted HicB family RNase H-like nuclease